MTGAACYISQCWEKGNDWGGWCISQCWEKGNDWGGMLHKSVLGEGE